MKVSTRGAISPFYVMEVMRAAAERDAGGEKILHLEVGQPSTPAPDGAIAAAHHALDNNPLGYTTALGIEPLRERITQHYREQYDVHLDSRNVAVTMGASGACVLAFLTCFDPGDRVAVMMPGYPCYRNMLQAFNIEVVNVAIDARTRFQPTPDVLAGHGDLDGVVLASPSNPTGTMIGSDEMTGVIDYCEDRDIRLISDEIYHGITYEQPGVTAWRPGGTALVVNSFSTRLAVNGSYDSRLREANPTWWRLWRDSRNGLKEWLLVADPAHIEPHHDARP